MELRKWHSVCSTLLGGNGLLFPTFVLVYNVAYIFSAEYYTFGVGYNQLLHLHCSGGVDKIDVTQGCIQGEKTNQPSPSKCPKTSEFSLRTV